MFNETQDKAFGGFAKAVNTDQALDSKTRHMVKLAAAAALGCYP